MTQYSDDFERFWQAYPRKIAKKAAFKSFERAIREGVKVDKILSAVAAYKVWLTTGEGWRPEPKHPSTYLNQGCWDDEYETSNPQLSPEESKRQARIRGFEKNGFWDDNWGQRPTQH